MNKKKSIFLKIIAVFITTLIINMSFCLSSSAFSFGRKKLPCDTLSYKLNYVNINWWQNFEDPYLKDYIIQAVKNNQDLKIATLKVEEYRQYVKQQFGYELPEASVAAKYIGIKTPFDDTADALNLSKSAYTLPFTVSYEADFLQKNRNKTQSAQKLMTAQKFKEKATYISICSNVATDYINILKTDKLICLQEDLVSVRKEELCRIEKKHARGLATTMEVNDYRKNYQSALNDLDTLSKNRAVMLDEFAVLIGESPANAQCLPRGSFDCFDFTGVLPDCVPSDVIFSRPDVLSAEEQLKGAKLDINVARKEFFPKFDIYGIIGFNTISPSPFWSWDGAFALLLAGATQDIFYGGRKVANLRLKQNKYNQIFESYKQTNLKAVQEVNDSLYAVKYDTNVDRTTYDRLHLQSINFERSNKKYNQGVISCPELLSEKEKLISLQTEKTNSKALKLVNYLSLYKAAGGRV